MDLEALQRMVDASPLHRWMGLQALRIDVAGDYAVAVRAGAGVPTVSLSVDYLRMVEGGALVAEAQLVKLGRRISLVDVRVLDDAGRLVALGRASYVMPAGG